MTQSVFNDALTVEPQWQEVLKLQLDATDYDKFIEQLKETQYYKDMIVFKKNNNKDIELQLVEDYKDYRENKEIYSNEHKFCMAVIEQLDSSKYWPIPFNPDDEWVYREACFLFKDGYSYTDAADEIYKNFDPTP